MGIKDMSRLQELKQRRDIGGLLATLEDEERSGTERRFAAAALGDLQARRAVVPLVAVLDDPDLWQHAMQALVKIGDPAAAAPLVELMYTTTDRFTRKKVRKALKQLHDKDPDEVRAVLDAYEEVRGRREARRESRRRRR